MPNIGALLKDEIARLCRKEIRAQVEPLKKASATYRREIAALKRQVQVQERQNARLARRAAKAQPESSPVESGDRPKRFVVKGLQSLRIRLGLSAPGLARLIGVSTQTIYNWEQNKSKPRAEQLAALAAIRGLGKREAQARLGEPGNS